MPKLQSPLASPLGVVTLAGAVAALLTPWTITIPGISGGANFGVQTPGAWLEVIAVVGAVMLARLDLALIALLVAVPTALLVALLITEFLPARIQTPVGAAVDLIAAKIGRAHV